MKRSIGLVLVIVFCGAWLGGTNPLGASGAQTLEVGANEVNSPSQRNIDTFPYTQDFEDPLFPPVGWTRFNRDGQGQQWESSTALNHTPGGQNSACHLHPDDWIDEDGWLVMPRIDVPTDQATALTFWSCNLNPQNYGTNTVLVSTTSPDPDAGNYSGIWSPVTVSDEWVYSMVDLTPWQGQSIWVAFWLRGFPTHEWFLDDVTVKEFEGIDSFPFAEDFESGVFPPYYWWYSDQDGSDTIWFWNSGGEANHSPDGLCSAVHLADAAPPAEDGWLFLPQVILPSDAAWALSFWSRNLQPESYGTNSIMLSAGSPDPLLGDFVSLWSPVTVSDNWVYNMVDLTPWAGQAVWIAFRYQGEAAHDWYLDDLRIEEYIGVHDFPFAEDFESGVFPPYYWTAYDQDGSGTFWSWGENFNHSEDGTCSTMHIWDNEEPDEDGWLVSPLLRLPTGANCQLTFWSYNINPQWYGSNSVMLSTGSQDPNDRDFVQIWHPDAVTEAWVQDYVDLSPWAGHNVFLAFRYEGFDAHDWYLDDILVEASAADNLPPLISHLPLLNTLRDDAPYGVYAEVQDDPVWNSGIAGVWIYYQIDGGDWLLVPMPPQGDGYYGEIPPQPLGSQINYVIVAEDASPQYNATYTSAYSFTVDEPAWLCYDSMGQSGWAGWNDSSWSLGTLFENPLWGADAALKINKVTATFRLSDAVSLRIWETDSEDLSGLTAVTEPLPVNVVGEQWIEVSIPDAVTTARYFYVIYDDIDAWNGFAFDAQRHYPGRCLFSVGTGWNDISGLGVWMLRAQVQSDEFLSAPVLTIINTPGGPELHWTPVPGADHYNVYGSENPSAPDPWPLFDSTQGLALGALGDWDHIFFKVTAAEDIPRYGNAPEKGLGPRGEFPAARKRELPFSLLGIPAR